MDLRGAVAKLFSARLLLAIIEFVAIAYLTRILGADAIGSFFLFQAMIGVAAIGSNFGLGRAAENELSAGEAPGEVMATVVLLKSLLTVLFIAGILNAQPYLDSYIGIEGASLFVALGLISKQGRRLVIRLLAGQMRVQQTASIQVVGKIAWVIVSVSLIQSGMNVLGVLIGYAVGDLIIALSGLVRLDLAVGRPSMERIRSQLRYGYYVVLRSSGSYVYEWVDVLVLGFFVPTSYIGAYEIAWRVATVTLQLTNAIRESIFPRISELHAANKKPELQSVISRWVQPPVYLTIPGFFGAIVLGEEVLGTLFGPEVVLAASVLVIFMAEKVVRTVHILFSAAVCAMDRPELGYRADVVALPLNLVLNLALIPTFGLVGAAVATTTSSVVAALISGRYLARLIDIHLPLTNFGWSVVSATVMTSCVYVIAWYFARDSIELAIGVVAGGIVYASLLLTHPAVRREILSFRRAIT